MQPTTFALRSLIGLGVAAVVAIPSSRAQCNLTFSNTPLIRPEGDSEPEISIAANGTMAMVGLQWLFNPASSAPICGPDRSDPHPPSKA